MQSLSGLNFLVSPLDWGLGHATRCIPVIRELQHQGAEVILVGSQNVLARLGSEFPELVQIQTDDWQVVYHKWIPAWVMIAFQAQSIKKKEAKTYAHLLEIIQKYKIHAIVSDNRYHVRAASCYSILITHQIQPKLPAIFSLLRFGLNRQILRYIHRFDEVWIPDFEDAFLSGSLSNSSQLKIPVKCLGLLSRLENPNTQNTNRHGVLAIASGPEPQLGIFINQLRRIYSKSIIELTILTSIPYYGNELGDNNCKIIHVNDDQEFIDYVNSAEVIICRSGYSTIMDLVALNRTALLVPTPGQTEQEYLAWHLSKHGFTSISQSKLGRIQIPGELMFPQTLLNLPKKLDSTLSQIVTDLSKRINRIG